MGRVRTLAAWLPAVVLVPATLAQVAHYLLALALAAWLLVRRIVPRQLAPTG